jgi:hypothetical protein
MKKVSQTQAEWPTWALELTPHIGEDWGASFGKFSEWMSKHEADIWTGREGLELEKKAHGEKRDRLISHCGEATAASEVVLRGWWDRLICAGNMHRGWKIELLPQVVKLPVQAPTYVRRDFQLLAEFREHESTFFSTMRAGVGKDALRSMLLCSAIICGGVTSLPMLRALLLMRPTAVRGYHGELRVALRLPYGKDAFLDGKEAYLDQTWYPDAVTAVLIVRWMSTANEGGGASDTVAEPAALSEIASALSRLRKLELKPRDFLRAARVAHSLNVTPYIAAYLANDLQAQSLPMHVMQRLNGLDPTLLDTDTDTDTGADGMPGASRHVKQLVLSDQFDSAAPPVQQLKVIAKVTKYLRTGGDVVDEIERELKQCGQGLWLITRLLCQWIRWRRSAGDDKEKALGQIKAVKGSSSARYLSAIARHLIAVAGPENPAEMDVDDLETLYELAAARVKNGQERAYFWGCIRSFHSYLMFYGAPEVSLEELDGFVTNRQGAISANLVSEQDFITFKDALRRRAGPSLKSTGTAVLLAAILGFRCGLRRREVQMLWLHQLHMGVEPWLLVRASNLATLKSRSAHRRIPLHCLLLPDELELLQAYWSQKVAQFGGAKALLFSNATVPNVPLPDRVLFDPITAAFQLISGHCAPQFKYHHLRHSFTNWLFLALVLADNPGLRDPDSPMISGLTEEHTSRIKKSLFPHANEKETSLPPTRRNLYLVSALLGHLSPETTLKWYMHVVDWLAGREVDIALATMLCEFKPPELAKLCGLSSSMAYKGGFQSFVNLPVQFLRHYVADHLPANQRDTPTTFKEPTDLTTVFDLLEALPLPSPSRMMVTLSHFLQRTAVRESDEEGKINSVREEALAWIERNHAIPRSVFELVYEQYVRIVAKQSGSHARPEFPTPPRPRADAIEFWRILDATEASFNSIESRPAMLETAHRLISRIGPSTGQIYLGQAVDMAPQIIDGLTAMGVPLSELALKTYSPSGEISLPLEFRIHIDAVHTRKVNIEPDETAWKKKEQRNHLFRIEIKETTGRIKGVNYAAIWLHFADAMSRAETNPADTAIVPELQAEV